MPAMGSFELIERIKADRRLRAVPIVVIAAPDDGDRIVRAVQMGAEDYILKPFEPSLLRLRINVQLERHRLRERVEAAEARRDPEQIASVTRIAELASFLVREHYRKADELGASVNGTDQLREIATRLDEAVSHLRK
jgi:PleD family two-component response regulator